VLRPHHDSHARYQARFDTATYAKLVDLTRTFHRTRSAILRYVMQWGLTRTQGWTVDTAAPVTVHPLSLLLEPDLLQYVHEAAAAHRTTVAAWLRQAMRLVTIDDFPGSWQAGMSDVQSHDSHTYGQRFMLRLDETTVQKLHELVAQFGRSRAEIIRQLITQATVEGFPESWHIAVAERRIERPQENSV
jgi:predicted transcriptional regulator